MARGVTCAVIKLSPTTWKIGTGTRRREVDGELERGGWEEGERDRWREREREGGGKREREERASDNVRRLDVLFV